MWNNQGGGGFQSYDQGGGFNSPGGFGTQQQSQEKKTGKKANTILPVTVAEILNAKQDEERFYTDDIEISQVTLVGLVREVKGSATRMNYEIDDMTGPPLEVKQFVDNDESVPDDERQPAMRENTYVRIYGSVRSFGAKRSVVAFKMAPVTDMNELTGHLLEVVHDHMSLSKLSGQGMSNGFQQTNSSYMDTGGFGDNSGMVSGLTPIQNQVHLAIRSNPTDQGASIDSVFKQIRGVPEKAIRDAIEFLSSEGHIYSTIDDDHYKATDS